jgi:UDP-N-acetylglucosamine transferase subunit ALG13
LGPGSNRRCHPNLLEVVSCGENSTRKGYFDTKRSAESNKKHSETNSKSVSIKKNGVDVTDDNGSIIEYTNAKECAKEIYKGKETDEKYEKKINNLKEYIIQYINGKKKSVSGYTEYTFVRGQSYIKSQEDLYITKWRLDIVNNKYVIEKYIVKEIWTYYEDLDDEHKKEIKDFFKDNKIPIAMSDCGRVMNQYGDKSYGKWAKEEKSRYYNNRTIYTIIWYWFASIEEIKKLQNGKQDRLKLCHCDGKIKHPLVKRQSENGEENTNIWGTFYLGDDDSNGKDKIANQLRKAQENKEGHFKAFKDGEPISDKIFVSTTDFNIWSQKNGYKEKFQCIIRILNPDTKRTIEHGLTFKLAYDTTDTSIEG